LCRGRIGWYVCRYCAARLGQLRARVRAGRMCWLFDCGGWRQISLKCALGVLFSRPGRSPLRSRGVTNVIKRRQLRRLNHTGREILLDT
jgi:hypothetical protein